MKHLYDVDTQGVCHMTTQGLIEMAYQDVIQHKSFAWQHDQDKQEYDDTCRMLDTSPFEWRMCDPQDRTWFTPAEYVNLDLHSWVLNKCQTESERMRAQTELHIIDQLDVHHIFKHLIYLVDVWRAHGLVWGLGRGSSVSCFVLYVIGINKINPLQYDLDHTEFFKINPTKTG